MPAATTNWLVFSSVSRRASPFPPGSVGQASAEGVSDTVRIRSCVVSLENLRDEVLGHRLLGAAKLSRSAFSPSGEVSPGWLANLQCGL